MAKCGPREILPSALNSENDLVFIVTIVDAWDYSVRVNTHTHTPVKF